MLRCAHPEHCFISEKMIKNMRKLIDFNLYQELNASQSDYKPCILTKNNINSDIVGNVAVKKPALKGRWQYRIARMRSGDFALRKTFGTTPFIF